MATLPGAWRYRVSTGTGRPGVSILGERESLICSFYLSVAACKNCLCRSVPEIHSYVAGTLSNQQTNNPPPPQKKKQTKKTQNKTKTKNKTTKQSKTNQNKKDKKSSFSPLFQGKERKKKRKKGGNKKANEINTVTEDVKQTATNFFLLAQRICK